MARVRAARYVLGSLTVALSVLAVAVGLSACGGSSDSGAEQLAKQQELQAARAQAAQDARQSAKITELERKLKHAGGSGSTGQPESPPPSPEASAPVRTESSLSGTWQGEAVIEYDSGKPDPFLQTIRIDSLQVGQVSGYSEALQGSTTCHGPLTYLGSVEGWYRFSSAEQNTAECIDRSEVELTPDGAGGLSYRETTDVSVSTGTLEPSG